MVECHSPSEKNERYWTEWGVRVPGISFTLDPPLCASTNFKINNKEITFLFKIDDFQVKTSDSIQIKLFGVVVDVLGHDGVLRKIRCIVRERIVGKCIVVLRHVAEIFFFS